MSPRDPVQGVTEPKFSISSQELGYVTPNLGYLAKDEVGDDRQSVTGLFFINQKIF